MFRRPVLQCLPESLIPFSSRPLFKMIARAVRMAEAV